jgi:hypothetical protein
MSSSAPPPPAGSDSNSASAAAAPAAKPAAAAPAGDPPAPPATTTTKVTKKKKVAPKKATGAGTKAKPTKKGGGSAAATSSSATGSKRKRPTPKKDTINTEAVLERAAQAQADLARMRHQETARRNDPLWYRIEDVLRPVLNHPHSAAHEANFGSTTVSLMASSPGILPEQCQVVESALQHAGMTRSDVTPQAMACLLEQARRYAQELMANAQDFGALQHLLPKTLMLGDVFDRVFVYFCFFLQEALLHLELCLIAILFKLFVNSQCFT